MLNIIVAMDKNGLIGNGNKLPWHLPNDLKHFKEKTKGHTVIMGRKTFESIGKPLVDRFNIVISNTIQREDVNYFVTNTEHILRYNKNNPKSKFFIIGGAEIYKQFLPYADKMYITHIEHEFEGNIYFPPIDWSQWDLKQRIKGIKDDKNLYDYYFLEYRRKGAVL